MSIIYIPEHPWHLLAELWIVCIAWYVAWSTIEWFYRLHRFEPRSR